MSGNKPTLWMDGSEVLKFAVRIMVQSTRTVGEKAGLTLDEDVYKRQVQFRQFEDKFLFEDWLKSRTGVGLGKYQTFISVLLIIVGAYMILETVWGLVSWNLWMIVPEIGNYVDSIFSNLPRVVVGVLIVVFGVKMIRGKKKEMKDDE